MQDKKRDTRYEIWNTEVIPKGLTCERLYMKLSKRKVFLSIVIFMLIAGIVISLFVKFRQPVKEIDDLTVQAAQKKHLSIAESLRGNKLWKESIKEYYIVLQNSVNGNENTIEAEFKIANIKYHQLGSRDEAAQHYLNIISKIEQFPQHRRMRHSLIEMGTIYMAKGKYEDALRIYTMLTDKYSSVGVIGNNDIYRDMAKCYIKLGKEKEAENILAKVKK